MRVLLIMMMVLSFGGQRMASTQPKSAAAVSTFLMFEGKAQDAMSLYASVFPRFHIEHIERYGRGEAGPEGSVKLARVDMNGQRLLFSDSYVKHGFTFTPSISLFIDFASAEELDGAFAKLSQGGKVLMPVDNYGFSRRFGWCADRFGVSWQLNLPDGVSAATRASG
jgi:predicted 3-demethylubiquinone-9 3-methyltransferase (glyoxalase superfamily)